MQLTPEEKHHIRTIVLPLVDDLYRVATQLTGRSDTAEDLVADTLARACERFRQLRDHSKVKQWLLRILTNTFISNYREQKKHRATVSFDEQGDEGFSLFDQLSVPFLLWYHNPERDLINKLLDEDIQKAIAALPEQFRVAVVLCDVEGLSYDEIAGTLNIPIGTVRSRVARGRSMLQKQLWTYAREAGIVPKRKSKSTSSDTLNRHRQKDNEHEAITT